jgi:uncharacterized protein YbjT (DUF2867 family)
MKRILVAGAAGGLGRPILKKLREKGCFVRALVRQSQDGDQIKSDVNEIIVGDASKPESLHKICENIDIVLSTLGKSVSLFSKDDKTFFETDYIANHHLLNEAKKSEVKRFIYVSIYGSDKYGDFELAKVHRKVEKELLSSGIASTIIRPVGIFVGLLDVLRMAKNGIVLTVGTGEHQTNPIHEVDLAQVCTNQIEKEPEILEVGGPISYTRQQIGELAIQAAGDKALHIHLPEILTENTLPFLQYYDQSFFDKLAFFHTVLTHDSIASKFGTQKLEDYFQKHVNQLEENWLDLFL